MKNNYKDFLIFVSLLSGHELKSCAVSSTIKYKWINGECFPTDKTIHKIQKLTKQYGFNINFKKAKMEFKNKRLQCP